MALTSMLCLRKVHSGRLCTTVFELSEENATTRRAIVKDIQYDPTNYNIIHLDFEELIEDRARQCQSAYRMHRRCRLHRDQTRRHLTASYSHFARHAACPKTCPLLSGRYQIMDVGEAKRLSDLNLPQTVQTFSRSQRSRCCHCKAVIRDEGKQLSGGRTQ